MSKPANREGRLQAATAGLAFLLSPIPSAQPDTNKEAKDYLSTPLNPKTSDPAKSIAIHQEIDFAVRPQQVYEALLDANQFAAFSGKTAEIDREVGGTFSLFKGHIIGRNLELIPNQRIAQGWEENYWSLLKKYFP